MSVSSLEVGKVFNSVEKISYIGKLFPDQSKNVNVKRFILRNQFFVKMCRLKIKIEGGWETKRGRGAVLEISAVCRVSS